MAGGDTVEGFTNSEKESYCSLALEHIQGSDRQAKCISCRIDDGLEGIGIRDRCEQLGTTEVHGHRLTVCNINVKNTVLLEEIRDVVGRVEWILAGESSRQDSHPDRDSGGDDFPVQGDLGVVIPVVPVLLNPAETNEVDGRMLDVLLVEQFNNLGTNLSLKIVAL